jgi:hypothetical protein
MITRKIRHYRFTSLCLVCILLTCPLNLSADSGSLPDTFVYTIAFFSIIITFTASILFAILTKKIFQVIYKIEQKNIWIQTFCIFIVPGSSVFVDGGFLFSNYPFKLIRSTFGNKLSLQEESIIFILVTLSLIILSSFIGFSLTKAFNDKKQ